jgi:hypothetical protein
MKTYEEFLKTKQITAQSIGIEPDEPNPILFPFQRDIVKLALRKGRACIWADCGLGKSFMQLEWARQIPGDVLILAPLAVAQQTVSEGVKLGITVKYCRDKSQVEPGITIANYEMLEHFEAGRFTGVVLDESAILRNYTGTYRNRIIQSFARTQYRLACTATPAPNDYMELGNHAEFVGAMSRTEMLSMFFVHDGGETSKWRIKGHAQDVFWKWVCSWAVMLRKPSDLGYSDEGFTLPPIRIAQHTVESNTAGDFLFPMEANTLAERISARRDSVPQRAAECAAIVRQHPQDKWIVWCGLNSEQEAIEKLLGPEMCVSVSGSDSTDSKIAAELEWRLGDVQVMITKPSIMGLGMNWQHCHRQVFVGLSDSWEEYYQSVRRCWRFGQKNDVSVHVVTAQTEGRVVENIKRKEKAAAEMVKGMVEHMHSISSEELKGTQRMKTDYSEDSVEGDGWTMHLGDCVDVAKTLGDSSIGFSVFSPPFASLYTYSASDRDMGNSKDYNEFETHFGFLVDELYRVLMPGRLISIHCMNLPTSKSHHGYIGIRDFRGDIIRWFESRGFIFHSEVCIWKDPVTAMQRTKALGLLHKQMTKDSCMSRQGIPDYLVTMRKPGDNPKPVSGELDRWIGDDSFRNDGRLSIDLWQRYASPVWMDINPSRTLQKDSMRDEKDERHICPLQLDVIERAMELWSNPGDVVLSPFAGIGSEGFVSVQTGRQFVGIELKESYYAQAVENLKLAEAKRYSEPTLL